MIGALDMGGSSTQLIFYNGTLEHDLLASSQAKRKKVRGDDFWSYSWSGFGVHEVQDRVMDYLLQKHLLDSIASANDASSQDSQTTFEDTEGKVSSGEVTEGSLKDLQESSESNDLPLALTIHNPCGFKGQTFIEHNKILSRHENPQIFEKSALLAKVFPHFDDIWTKGVTVRYIGNGEGEQCFHLIEKVVWDENNTCVRGKPCPIDEVEHPSIEGHHFYAMGCYLFAFDSMKLLGPGALEHWPNPTLEELEQSTMQFCAMDWDALFFDYKENKPHPYTNERELKNRCFQALYMITLLEKGFGFQRQTRTITYALEVSCL
jgi:hypothetical protein